MVKPIKNKKQLCVAFILEILKQTIECFIKHIM